MGDERRLESWKEIGVYLQKDLRTARRWEKEEGLPVHRHSRKSRASVYAFPSEIDAWRASRKVVPEPVPLRLLWKIPAFAVTLLLCLVMVGNGVRPAGAQQNQALAKRLLCAECGDSESDLSLDGRSMAVTEWWSGDLGIQDTSTGQIKRLMVKAGDWKDSEAFAESPVFSRDLSQMAYLWDTGEKPFHGQLRIASNDSGKFRVVLDNPENNYYQPLDWSPDGKRLLVSIQKLDKTWQLEWVSAVDGAVVLLKSVGWRFYNTGNRPRLSPNGQFIAYSALAENPGNFPPSPNFSREQHIYVLAADGSAETELVKTAGTNEHPVWTPDGAHILFVSDRTGAFGLWSVPVRDGKASGPQTLVSPNSGEIHGFGVGARGSFFYRDAKSHLDQVSLAAIESGKTRAIETFAGASPRWSPDGKLLAFKKARLEGGFDLVVRSLNSGEERTYRSSLGAAGIGPSVWFHDSKGLITGISHGDTASAFRIDLKSGQFEEISGMEAPGAYSFSLSPDDKTLYRILPFPHRIGAPSRIVAIDMATGRQRDVSLLSAGSQFGNLSISPDGKTLGLIRYDEKTQSRYLASVVVDDGIYQEIYTFGPTEGGITWQAGFSWTKDGSGVLFTRSVNEHLRQMIRVPILGGPAEAIGQEVPGSFQSIDLNPDGSRLAFGISRGLNEVWAFDNVLSVLK